MVYYLKYRPKTLSELDNPVIADMIGKYLSKTSIPHAFLFTGPKGIGKTSTARIVAKSINCPNAKPRGNACGVCTTCVSIANGSNLDILEIDAASNRGIDEIRDLREKIKLAPTNLKYKVYIIDEVHMLTTEAFNALLKTLEEPPAHAFFILATTETHKVPETILSRCIRVEFQRATTADILHSLKRVDAGEKLKFADDILREIAEAADGSFRDAHKLLEEIVISGSSSLATVRTKLGLTDKKLEIQFMDLLLKKNAKELLLLVRHISNEGKNIRVFFVSILKNLEELLLSYFDKKSTWEKADLFKALTLFSKAFVDLKTSMIPTLPFELAIVEFCVGTYQPMQLTNTTPQGSKAFAPTAVDESVTPLATRWAEFLEIIKKQNTTLVGVLRSCRPISLKNNVLVLEAAYKFHADRVNDPKVRNTIANAIKDLLGLTVSVQAHIKKRV